MRNSPPRTRRPTSISSGFSGTIRSPGTSRPGRAPWGESPPKCAGIWESTPRGPASPDGSTARRSAATSGTSASGDPRRFTLPSPSTSPAPWRSWLGADGATFPFSGTSTSEDLGPFGAFDARAAGERPSGSSEANSGTTFPLSAPSSSRISGGPGRGTPSQAPPRTSWLRPGWDSPSSTASSASTWRRGSGERRRPGGTSTSMASSSGPRSPPRDRTTRS